MCLWISCNWNIFFILFFKNLLIFSKFILYLFKLVSLILNKTNDMCILKIKKLISTS